MPRFSRTKGAALVAVLFAALLGPATLMPTPAVAAPAVCTGSEATRWTGSINSDWFTAGNWTAGIPTAGQSICISTGPAQPVLTSNASVAQITAIAGTTFRVNGATLTTTGSNISNFDILEITNNGTYQQTGSGSASVNNNFRFFGGTLAGTNAIGVTGLTSFISSASKTIAQELTLNGSTNWLDGNITSTATNGIINKGIFTSSATAGLTLTASSFNNLSGATFLKQANGNNNIDANFNNAAGASILIAGGQSFTIAGSGRALANAGSIDIGNTTSLNFVGGNVFIQSAGITNVFAGGTLGGTNFVQNGGTTNVDGTFQPRAIITDGTFTLGGTINNLVSLAGGTFDVGSVGGPAAIGTVTGAFSQTGGTLVFDVVSSGTTPGTSHDQLVVGGGFSSDSNSTLSIRTGSFVPADGQTARVVQAPSYTGAYASASDDLAGSRSWTVDYASNPITVTASTQATPTPPTTAPSASGPSYLMTGSDGKVYNFGSAKNFGSAGRLNASITDVAPTATGEGYYQVATDGGVFTYGDAVFAGSTGDKKLNAPMVGVAANPAGAGYWTVASDGGVFAYGGAEFLGSVANLKLNAPVLDIVPTSTGNGYWLVAGDGGVFSFGDASFKGSTGAQRLNAPVVGMGADYSTGGYWLVAADGGVFTFGGAAFQGSTGDLRLNKPVVGMRTLGDARGYWLIAADGGVFSFGAAPFLGVPGATLTAPIVN